LSQPLHQETAEECANNKQDEICSDAHVLNEGGLHINKFNFFLLLFMLI
jgi:hypothetical protein